MLYTYQTFAKTAVANAMDYEIDDAWTGIHDNGHVIFGGGMLATGGLRAITHPKCKKQPSKIEKVPLKIAIDCNVKLKACSMSQI